MTSSTQPGLDAELALAARVQSSLLPPAETRWAGWEIACSYEPARYVSGDYVDLIESGPDAFHFMLGDVSGKGVAAALLMVHLHATIRDLLEQRLELDQVVRETSSRFCHSSLPAQFVTLVIGTATRSGDVELVNAGHPPVLLVRQSATEVLSSTNLPLGLFCSGDNKLGSGISSLRASRGDMLLLYSDGVTETFAQDGTEYGVERLQELLSDSTHNSAGKTITAVLDDLTRFSSIPVLADDRSVLGLRFIENI